VFEEMNAMQHFEAFTSLNGPRFYGLPVNEETIELVRTPVQMPEIIETSDDSIVPFLAGEHVSWSVKK